ncbi:MAG: xanthine dehydrogenase family protein subunit M [Bradyrhizobiaceae bacterium]|nr:MAG: xanthine dehydrogenase family protein subunit M [Bradyrhizobiaceae bacterium]
MQTFQIRRADSADAAIRGAAAAKTAQQGADIRFLAGGTTLLDLMKLNVETPKQLIDIKRLPLDKIETLPDGALRIGATVKNADLANDERVQRDYPVLSQALLSGASAQLRNMATTGGNLLQRTRCLYFRDTGMACNKRDPGSGCAAIGGFSRNLAILGVSDQCIATNPSDMNVALMALDATIHIKGATGERAVPIADFFLLPGKTPDKETVMQPGDLITHVTLPAPAKGERSLYLKLRDRASYEFALASAAVVMTMDGDKIGKVAFAMGGIGVRPWRDKTVEAKLTGQSPDRDAFRSAAEAFLKDARPQEGNAFKVELARRCLVHTLETAAKLA